MDGTFNAIATRESKKDLEAEYVREKTSQKGKLKRIQSYKIYLTLDYIERINKTFPNSYVEKDGQWYNSEGKEINVTQ